jgi:hypothetical protein
MSSPGGVDAGGAVKQEAARVRGLAEKETLT